MIVFDPNFFFNNFITSPFSLAAFFLMIIDHQIFCSSGFDYAGRDTKILGFSSNVLILTRENVLGAYHHLFSRSLQAKILSLRSFFFQIFWVYFAGILFFSKLFSANG